MKTLKVGVYPFDEVFIPNLRYEALFENISFCALINHNGDKLSGKQIREKSSFANEYTSINWSRFSGAEEIDTLLITEDIEKLDMSIAISVIEKYCKTGVGIIATGMNDENKRLIQQICKKYGTRFETKEDCIKNNKMIDYKNLKYTLSCQAIDTPIVCVLGVAPMTQKYEIQLNLRSNFINDGYKVSQIGTGHMNELIGGYSITDVLLDNNLPETHKIYFMNHFLKEIEERENPDVIIIGIEDPILPLSQSHHFNFGIFASELFNAFAPDVSLVTLLNGEYNDDFYEELKTLCKYKYNFELDAYFVSRFIPTSASMYRDKLSYTYAEKIEQSSGQYSVFSNDDIESNKIYEFVKLKLEQYGRCEQF